MPALKRLGSVAVLAALTAVGTAALPSNAKAWWRHDDFGIRVWVPPVVVARPPPVVYAAPPPPVVYTVPPPVVYAPPPPRRFYRPRRIWIPPHWHHGFWIRGHWS